MKKIYLSLIVFLFISNARINAQEIDIINFDCSESIVCYTPNIYAQYFTLPAENDYCITKIGVQLTEQSDAAKIFLALYNGSGTLLFKSREIVYPGGVNTTVIAEVPECIQTLAAGTGYYAAVMFSGTNLYIKRQSSPVNSGIATVEGSSQFNSLANYPDFSDPLSPSGSYGFSMGFVIKGSLKPETTEPENEILEFNCTSSIQLEPNTIYYSQVTLQGTENKMLRQIGLKTDTCSAEGKIKCAVYDASFNLLYVTDEAAVNITKADTSYIPIPENQVELVTGATYYLAFQFSGIKRLAVQRTRIPQNRGIATASEYSWFKTGQTYAEFPELLTADGSYAFSFGFVLNGDDPGPGTGSHYINSDKIRNIKVLPTLAEDHITLYSNGTVSSPVEVKLYGISGKLEKAMIWSGTENLTITIPELSSGMYFISIYGSQFNKQVIKFIKR